MQLLAQLLTSRSSTPILLPTGSLARMSLPVLALWVVTDLRLLCSAVLADGQFPGPPITANKVNHSGRLFGLFLNLHSLGRHLFARRL